MKHLFITFLLFIACHIQAQPELTSYDDGVYRDYIKSVKLTVTGLFLTLPIAPMGLMNTLLLTFDELDGSGTRYYYTVIHCDRDWHPTQELTPFDYLEGYREGEIKEYDISRGTYHDYLQYHLTIPNEDVKWKISGNYLLVVYESGQENNPVITRRFMVSEEKVSYRTDVVQPADVAKEYSSQEIDFGMETKNLGTTNPRGDLFTYVMQNGRWDNILKNVEPRTITGTYLTFDYQDRIVFDAGKEFRNLDISSLIYKSEYVMDIYEYPEGISTIVFPEDPRANRQYIWREDLDGMFVPYNSDYDRKPLPIDSLASSINLAKRYNYREQNLSSDYTEVQFTLKLPFDFGREIYIVGGLSDWKMLPDFRMTYDERVNAYVGRLLLKQGYYNYQYAVPDDKGNPDFSVIEGNWYATENQYTLLTYYRPRGSQYDRLVGAHTFNSNP